MIVLGSGFLGAQLKKDFNALGVSRSGKHGISANLLEREDYLKLPTEFPSTKNVVVFAASPDSSSVESYKQVYICLLYTSPSPRDATLSRMPSSA